MFQGRSFRRPLPPAPVECFDISHPAIPAALDGLTILHVSDLHVRRRQLASERYQMILHALEETPADLIAITGDLMDEPGDEGAALDTMKALAASWRPRLGVFCVFGNHDTPEFQRAARRELSQINFIGGTVLDLNIAGAILRMVGLDWPEDPLTVLLNAPAFPEMSESRTSGATSSPSDCETGERAAGAATVSGGVARGLAPPPATDEQPFGLKTSAASERFTLALAHHPTSLIGVAELGVPLMLAGHTHAGQVRLHTRFAPHTSSDLPPHLATGVLRLKDTLCCITRGLGDGVVEHLRINCPRQMPLYTLRTGPLAAVPDRNLVSQVKSW